MNEEKLDRVFHMVTLGKDVEPIREVRVHCLDIFSGVINAIDRSTERRYRLSAENISLDDVKNANRLVCGNVLLFENSYEAKNYHRNFKAFLKRHRQALLKNIERFRNNVYKETEREKGN